MISDDRVQLHLVDHSVPAELSIFPAVVLVNEGLDQELDRPLDQEVTVRRVWAVVLAIWMVRRITMIYINLRICDPPLAFFEFQFKTLNFMIFNFLSIVRL